MQLARCVHCQSFIAPSRTHCSHCRALSPLKKLAVLVVGSALSVTLAACYGAPCAGNACQPLNDYPCPDASLDKDGDGYCGDYDCNEMDPKVNVDAEDTAGNDVDENCDGVDGVQGTTGPT